MSNLITAFSQLGREAARMVLPSPCIVCHKELPWQSRSGSCCETCWSSLPRIVEPKCSSCACVWTTTERNVRYTCGRCIESPPQFEWIDAWGHYSGGLELVLHRFKFSRHEFLARPLAGLLSETFEASGGEAFDCVIPLPMHPRKERSRGFNQAALLAVELARRSRLRLRTDLATRIRLGKPQSSLPRDERGANVRGSFAASDRCRGMSILIVDDICTTGETLNACSSALLSAGAARVCGLVVARA